MMKATQRNKLVIADTANDLRIYIAQGQKFLKRKRLTEAEGFFRKALTLDHKCVVAHSNLGHIRHLLGDFNESIRCYKEVVKLSPHSISAKLNLASLLASVGHYKMAKPLLIQMSILEPDDIELFDELTRIAMQGNDLKTAAKFADRHALLNRGSRKNKSIPHDMPIPEIPTPEPIVSVEKLRHDIAQFRYMQKQGIINEECEKNIKLYTSALTKLSKEGKTSIEISDIHNKDFRQSYNRILYRTPTPRIRQALSKKWNIVSAEDNCSAEKDYLRHPLGLTVIDNFLTDKSLNALRKFCLESTVWSENRYSYGRLGAFFREGFNCPLLIQIGEEIRAAFPTIIGSTHPLLQIWGFKCNNKQPFLGAHADFAAVNVNFWITPDDANMNSESGGMVIYDVEAPMSWDFDSYNKQSDKIAGLLKKRKANNVTIPYKSNRAIIFNSDLFHATSAVDFREGYENKRINITLLYGRRENAV